MASILGSNSVTLQQVVTYLKFDHSQAKLRVLLTGWEAGAWRYLMSPYG